MANPFLLNSQEVNYTDLKNQVTPKEEGFFKSLAKDTIRTFAKPLASAYNVGAATKALVTGKGAEVASAELDKSRTIPGGVIGDFMEGEKIEPTFKATDTFSEGTKKIVGTGAEIGSWFVGGGGAKQVVKQTLKGKVIKGLAEGAKYGATGGALAMGGRSARDLESAGDIAINTGIGAVTGLGLGGVLGAATPLAVKGVQKLIQPIEAKVKGVLRDAIEKGIKPYFKSTKTPDIRERYYADAENAFRTIKKYEPEITNIDEGTKEIRNPENRAEMLEALGGTKKQIYKAYHQIAVDAGEEGAKYNPQSVLDNLDSIAVDKKYNPEVRKYAESVKVEIEELANEAPEVIEARIQDLNASLAGYYDGRVTKAKAQIDASVAALMRKELGDLIENTTGAEYQALKNEYKALKTVEDDLARQVAVEARKNPRGLIDMTDIFTGADLIVGAISQNPAQFARGATGFAFKEWFKWVNNPNRFIKKAFEVLDEAGKVSAGSSPISRANEFLKDKAGLSIKDVSGGKPPNLSNPAVGQTVSPKRQAYLEKNNFNKTNYKPELKRFVAEVKKSEPKFIETTEDLASDVGGEYTYRMKETIADKIERRPEEFTLGQMDDVFGSTIITDKPDIVIAKAKTKYGVKKIDNFNETPTYLGYKGIHMDYELPSGQVGEIQIHTKQGLYKKETAHIYYERYRKFIEGAKDFEEAYNKIPKELQSQFKKDVKTSNDIYNGIIPPDPVKIKYVDSIIKKTTN